MLAENKLHGRQTITEFRRTDSGQLRANFRQATAADILPPKPQGMLNRVQHFKRHQLQGDQPPVGSGTRLRAQDEGGARGNPNNRSSGTLAHSVARGAFKAGVVAENLLLRKPVVLRFERHTENHPDTPVSGKKTLSRTRMTFEHRERQTFDRNRAPGLLHGAQHFARHNIQGDVPCCARHCSPSPRLPPKSPRPPTPPVSRNLLPAKTPTKARPKRRFSKRWTLETLPILPDWKHVPNPDSADQLKVLVSLMNRADVTEIVNAADAGREGEAIFMHVYVHAKCRKPVKRLWVSSMEESALREGFQNLQPGENYENLYAAALCRERADWAVGINATRLFSVLYDTAKPLNVGRVQSPTLALIAARQPPVGSAWRLRSQEKN